MNVVAVIQARMGSTRLAGKVLAPIAGRPMLEWVWRRVRQATTTDRIVVATSTAAADDAIADVCRGWGVECFRGSEADVLDRYHRAAEAHGADVVVRITSDCPLIDPQVIDRVVAGFLGQQPDYASNVIQRTWPRGLDTEAMSVAALARAAREATAAYERVHVTPHFYEHPDRFRLLSITAGTGPFFGQSTSLDEKTSAENMDLSPSEDWSGHRWTVDGPEDLAFVRAVYQRLGGDGLFPWQDVRDLVTREPELAALNRHVRHKQLHEG